MPSATGKILVIRGGAIGDFILTLPVLSALRAQFPGIRLELLGYPRVAQLALAGGLVDQVQSIEARPMACFFARGGPLPEPLAEYFGSFALIISYLFDPDRIFHENVARCSKAQFLVGPYRPDEQGGLHATQAFLSPLQRLAIFDADPTPQLTLPPVAPLEAALAATRPSANPQALAQVQAFPPHEWLALHPGSGSEKKNWPEKNWVALIQSLISETSLRILLVGGEVEGERLTRLAVEVPPARLRIAQSLPLAGLGALLQQCWGYIGHDSGISHLAAALGLPGLILWGETSREVWRPRSERVQLLSSASGLSSLGVEEVLQKLREVSKRWRRQEPD